MALDNRGAIGRKGNLLFHISDDLRRFKDLTAHHPIIMGRKTFESLPKGALPLRRNIVVTRNTHFSAPGVEVADNIDTAISLTADADETFVIGGGEIYSQTIDRVDRLYLTIVDTEVTDADSFFPFFNPEEWHITETSLPKTDEKSGMRFRFVNLQRITPINRHCQL